MNSENPTERELKRTMPKRVGILGRHALWKDKGRFVVDGPTARHHFTAADAMIGEYFSHINGIDVHITVRPLPED